MITLLSFIILLVLICFGNFFEGNLFFSYVSILIFLSWILYVFVKIEISLFLVYICYMQ